MAKTKLNPLGDSLLLLRMPGWMARFSGESIEEAAFLSGAALAHLDLAVQSDAVPQALWRARLALTAAEVSVGFMGRRERAAGLRDALHLLRPGDHPGPAGEVFQQWSTAVMRPISVAGLAKALPHVPAEQIALCLDATGGNPVDRAAAVLEAVLSDAPRSETAALILADAVLASSLGWDHLLPVLALALRSRDLRIRGDDLRRTCHRAVTAAAGQALSLAGDLARRAARLQAVAPKLRAKGADRAVQIFLSRDALAPAALTAFMSDRAARRLCDRLVELGTARELTGRDSFRLYGV
jgi:hypothetical protein